MHDLSEVQFDTFLSPFLEVIRSEATDGPITARSLAAVEKFINYGLLTANKFVEIYTNYIARPQHNFIKVLKKLKLSIRIGGAVQSIADAVTKAKFLGTSKAGIDECVLFQILQVFFYLLLQLKCIPKNFSGTTFIVTITGWVAPEQ